MTASALTKVVTPSCSSQTVSSPSAGPKDVVRFSLRCHVLSRRPSGESSQMALGLPETLVPEFSQEDLDAWVSIF